MATGCALHLAQRGHMPTCRQPGSAVPAGLLLACGAALSARSSQLTLEERLHSALTCTPGQSSVCPLGLLKVLLFPFFLGQLGPCHSTWASTSVGHSLTLPACPSCPLGLQHT